MESFCRFPVLIRAFALFCAIDLALACNGFACHGGRRAVRRVGGGYRCICDAGHRGENVDEPAPRQRREADMGESPVIGETEEEMGESPAMDESEGEAAITGESLTMDESEGEAAITGGSPVIGESEGEAAIMEENSVIDESEGEAAITDDSSVTDDSDGEAAIMGESSVIGESEGEAELLIGDNESESGKTSPIEDESEGEAAVTGESFIGESEDSMGESLVESEGGADVIGESSVVGESEEGLFVRFALGLANHSQGLMVIKILCVLCVSQTHSMVKPIPHHCMFIVVIPPSVVCFACSHILKKNAAMIFVNRTRVCGEQLFQLLHKQDHLCDVH